MPSLRTNHSSSRAIVFYDGGCPLCSKEINHYRSLSGSDKLIWIDITDNPRKLDNFGLSYEAAMARLHVLDASGQWQTGAWAFVELWSHLRGYRWLANLISVTHTQVALDRIYRIFARKRFNSRCSEQHCGS